MNNNTNTTRRAVNKSKKNVYKPTLDVQHNTFVSTIQEKTLKRNELLAEKARVEKEIFQIEESMREHEIVDDAVVEKYTSLKDMLIEINDELRQIDNDFNEQMYYTNTASILFEYYDLVEKGHSHSMVDKAVESTPAPPTLKTKPTNSILDYFKTGSATNSPKKSDDSPRPVLTPSHFQEQLSSNKSRGALLTKYMKYTDPEYSKVVDHSNNSEELCPHCGSNKLMIMTNDGYQWCTNCDSIEYIIIDHEKPSYRDPPKEISFFAYKRSNHLNEWISQIQGKETTEIPEEVYDKILMEIKKQRITNMAEITPKKIKSILKSLHIHKYYEHSAHIINRLTGIPAKQLSPELEEQLRNMFKQIQTPFLKHAPRTRKNFLSYSFVLHKLVQLLGKDEYLGNFSLLKARDKLMQQDLVWRKICEELNWEFYPSL